jgi:NAD(P)-dependent dehydrogenase (short-subunit alcohol dehydrogenase family)
LLGGRQPRSDNQRAAMNITNKTVLITGANRGIGRALVYEALQRRVKRVYAGTRGALSITDERVISLALDVTSASQIAQAADAVGAVDVLINNAGIVIYGDFNNLDSIEQHLAVNVFGALNVTRAFLPQLRSAKGAIVNHLSLASLASVPIMPAYSISKAAALNMTQALRAFLAGQGVTVHGVILGPVDTDMSRDLEIPKATPESVARGIFDGLEEGDEDIFPDPASMSIADSWRAGVAKALERRLRPSCRRARRIRRENYDLQNAGERGATMSRRKLHDVLACFRTEI